MPAVDLTPSPTYSKGPFGPLTHGETVTPNDGADLVNVSVALSALVSGACSVIMADGTGPFLIQLTAGQPFGVRVSRVRATGTTATGIVALS